MKKIAIQKKSEIRKTTTITVTRDACTGKYVESNMPNLLKNRPLKIKFY
jgi:hypothetical protein